MMWLVICAGCIVDRVEYAHAMTADDVVYDLVTRYGFPAVITVRAT